MRGLFRAFGALTCAWYFSLFSLSSALLGSFASSLGKSEVDLPAFPWARRLRLV